MTANQNSIEEIEDLYEVFLQTGDLTFLYQCLERSCSVNNVAQSAIDLIKSKYGDDEEGNAAIISAIRSQSTFIQQHFQYSICVCVCVCVRNGLSEGKIWKLLAEIYGGEPESIKRQFKRKLKGFEEG